MLGPVFDDHSLELVLYSSDMRELARPKVNSDGTYDAVIKGYTGIVIAKLVDSGDSTPDYIDEATGQPKNLGGNVLLSVIDINSSAKDQKAKLNITPLSTVAAVKAGIDIVDDVVIPSIRLSKDTVVTFNCIGKAAHEDLMSNGLIFELESFQGKELSFQQYMSSINSFMSTYEHLYSDDPKLKGGCTYTIN